MPYVRAVNLTAAAYGWLAVLATAVSTPFALRSFLVFTFALTCPGLPIVSRLHRTDWLEQLVLAVGVSICLSALVAEAMGVLARWSPVWGMVALASITTVGALLPQRRAVPAPAGGPPSSPSPPAPPQFPPSPPQGPPPSAPNTPSGGPPPDPWVPKGA